MFVDSAHLLKIYALDWCAYCLKTSLQQARKCQFYSRASYQKVNESTKNIFAPWVMCTSHPHRDDAHRASCPTYNEKAEKFGFGATSRRSFGMAFLSASGRRDIYKSEFWKGGKMTFITRQAINLWESEGIVKLFCGNKQLKMLIKWLGALPFLILLH